MQVLLVEDDEFKATDLQKALEEVISPVDIMRAASATSASKLISSRSFDACILDMSLPTFDLSGPGGGGSPQSQGGLEVLRLARRLKFSPRFIIVTQYPDIEISGRDIPLAEATSLLSKQFGLDVIACLLYEFDDANWRNNFKLQASKLV